MATMSVSPPDAAIARALAVAPKLTKMTLEDNPEAFVVTFERVAESAQWPKAGWAIKIDRGSTLSSDGDVRSTRLRPGKAGHPPSAQD